MEQRERDVSQPAASADHSTMLQRVFFSGTGKAISTDRVHFTRLNLLKGKLVNSVHPMQKNEEKKTKTDNLDWKAPKKGKINNSRTELQWLQIQYQPSARNICGLTFAEMC